MPVLRSIRERFARERPLEGVVVGACLHVTSETAVLVRTLQAGGADVALCASNPFAIQQDVALALCGEAEVHAGGPDEWADGVAAVVARAPRITLDDGADLLGALHIGAARTCWRGCSAGPRRRPPGSCGCARWRPRAGWPCR